MHAVIVFRHGQTDHNAGRRFQGQLDTPLNETGRAQAARTGDIVASCLRSFLNTGAYGLEAVTSDLSRARETAGAVARAVGDSLAVPCFFREDSSWREWDCGELQDLTIEEYEARRPGVMPEFYRSFEKDPENTPYPGGECKRDVRLRLTPSVDGWNEEVDWTARRGVLDDAAWMRAARGIRLVSTHGGIVNLLLEMLRCPLAQKENVIGNGDVLILVPHAVGEKGRWKVFRHYRVGNSVAAKL